MNLFQAYFYLKNAEKCEEFGGRVWLLLDQNTDLMNSIEKLENVIIIPILDFYYHYTVVARMLKMDRNNYLIRYQKFVGIIEKVKDKHPNYYFNYMIETSIFRLF